MSRAERAAEMAALIERWEASGQTQRAFAEQEGVTYSAFQYWRRRLQRSARETRRAARTAAPSSPVELAPVRIVPDSPAADPPAARGPAFEVRTASGLSVAVPPGFDEGELRRLLGALAAC